MKFRKFLQRSWREGNQIDSGNIATACILGGGSHIALYFIYSYVIVMPYESFAMRIFCSILCISTCFYKYLPERVKGVYFPLYWQIMIMSALTFNTVFYLLKTNFHEIYLYWLIVVVMITAVYVPNWFIFLANLLISSICAVILFVAITSNINLDPQFNAPGYSMVLLFAGVSGIIFVYYNRDVWLLKQALRYKKLGCAQEKRLTALAGSIAHEVRNPLNAISLSANQIRNFTNEAKGKREMDRMDCVIEILFSSIKRSNNIIDAILGQLKGQKIDDRNFKYYSVKDLCNRSVKEFGYENKESQSRVSMEVSQDFAVRVDETLLMHVYFNLIKNALYYSNSTVKIYDENGGKIVVEDNGPGISEDRVKNLFQDFETSGKVGGTGLGLSFCKRVMESFGGSIRCESEVGKWTKFILSFEKIEGGVVAEGSEEREGQGVYSIDLTKAKKTLKGKEFLIVDDEKLTLTMLSSFLRKNGMKVQKFNNAKGLLEKYKEQFEGDRDDKSGVNKYNIITDVNMPEMTGDELIKEIRLFESTNSVENPAVIVAYSGDNDEEKMAQLKKDGANDCFVKGGDLDGLLRVLAIQIGVS